MHPRYVGKEGLGKSQATDRPWGHEDMYPRELTLIGLGRELGNLKEDVEEKLSIWHLPEREPLRETTSEEDPGKRTPVCRTLMSHQNQDQPPARITYTLPKR